MSDAPPVLCVLVDAFRHDYLDSGDAPFLSSLAAAGDRTEMHPILGYSDAIRASIFTSRYPDEHGYWMEYCYRPGARAFRPLERLALLDRLPSDFVRRGLKFTISQTYLRRVARARGYDTLSLRHFPFRSLDTFDWTLHRGMTSPDALGAPTLFDTLSERGVPWAYLDSHKIGRKGVRAGLDALEPGTRLVFVYLHHIDMASHVVGIESGLFGRSVRKTDAFVEEVHGRVGARLGEPRTVVFSDHGMSRVDRIVSYPSLWTHPGFPRRFCVALDATMVRVWWVDAGDELRRDVRETIVAGAPGRFLGEEERAALHLSFGDRLYGDEIYLLEPGVAIFPNFHSMLRPKAMHAYHPDDPDQQGIVIAPRGELTRAPAELVDISPLLLRLLGERA